jgi:hypothetical protein
MDGPARPGRKRHLDGLDELAWLERRHARSDEEIVERDRAPTALPHHGDPRAVHEKCRCRVGRR